MTTIKCTQCGKEIELSEALTKDIEKTVIAAEHQKHLEELTKAKTEASAAAKKEAEEAIELAKKKFAGDVEVAKKKADAELEIAKKKLEAESEAIQKKAVADQEMTIKNLQAEAASQKQSNKELREQLGDLMKELREERKAKENIELEMQKKLTDEESKIREDATKQADEKQRLNLAAKEKTITDLKKALDEAQRKAEQGSQQLQGEVLELELEAVLKANFPYDEITPVAKGVNGADTQQKIIDKGGKECGAISWEAKYTKAWKDEWIGKLKDDQVKAKSEVGVIVSKILPKNVKNFAFIDGVWVSNFECLLPLAQALRANLIQISSIKNSMVGKNEKMEVVYNYLNGTEFRHRVGIIVEAFVSMQKDLETEKRAMTKIWSKREKQIRRVIDNTSGMYGDLQGLIGNSMPAIAELELPLLEDSDEEEVVEVGEEEKIQPKEIPF